VRHVSWFLEAVEKFRFFDLKVYPFAIRKGQSCSKAEDSSSDGAYLSTGLRAVPACGKAARIASYANISIRACAKGPRHPDLGLESLRPLIFCEEAVLRQPI